MGPLPPMFELGPDEFPDSSPPEDKPFPFPLLPAVADDENASNGRLLFSSSTFSGAVTGVSVVFPELFSVPSVPLEWVDDGLP